MADVSIDVSTLRNAAANLGTAASDAKLDGGCVRASEGALGSPEVASVLQRVADEQELRGELTAAEMTSAGTSAQKAADQFSSLDRTMAGPV